VIVGVVDEQPVLGPVDRNDLGVVHRALG